MSTSNQQIRAAEPRPPLTARWAPSRGIIGIAILVPFGAVTWFSTPRFAEGSLAATSLQSLGWGLLFLGTLVRFWATIYIGTSKGKFLILDGPYSVCRNPLYFGTFLITLSIPAFLQSEIFAAGVILASSVYLWITVSAEEDCLRRRFGAQYLDYCRLVPRFWPSFAHFRSPAVVEFDVRALRIECLRALRWSLIPVIAQLVFHFRMGSHY